MAEFVALPNPGDRCASYTCVNRVGDGSWVLVTLAAVPATADGGGLKSVHLSMCGSCATRLSREMVPGNGDS